AAHKVLVPVVAVAVAEVDTVVRRVHGLHASLQVEPGEGPEESRGLRGQVPSHLDDRPDPSAVRERRGRRGQRVADPAPAFYGRRIRMVDPVPDHGAEDTESHQRTDPGGPERVS